MLTNKAIAEKNHFQKLYKVFADKYFDVGDQMEKYLSSIQVLEFCDTCNAYLRGEYNALIHSIRLNGYVIRNISDKKKINDIMSSILSNHALSIWQAIKLAVENKLIKLSDSCIDKIERERSFVEQYSQDVFYKKFKELYLSGKNTYNKIKDAINISSEDVFDDWEAVYKRERFINELLSPDLKFIEALNYSKYLAEDTEYITMHKTKGSSIQNVIVVMEEFFWNEYNFSSLYSPESDTNNNRVINSKKLIYVACSRAISELVCVRVLTSDEVESFKKAFPQAEEIF